MNSNTLANDFGKFFMKKIDKINHSFEELAIASPEPFNDTSDCTDNTHPLLVHFMCVSQEEVRDLMRRMVCKSYPLDPMSTAVVRQWLDVLLPVITNMINLSFASGHFVEAWKEALVLPTFKELGLDIAFKNFRRVSNLPFISKLSEREAPDQLIHHTTVNNLHSPLQSAYKKHHRTETALLKVKDTLMYMNDQHFTLLVLLDLS